MDYYFLRIYLMTSASGKTEMIQNKEIAEMTER